VIRIFSFKETKMSGKEITAIGFDYGGKNYVIKVIQVGNKYIVKPYHNGRVASHYSYSVEMDSINIDTWENLYGNKPPYVRLIEIAELDIQEGYGVRKDIKP